MRVNLQAVMVIVIKNMNNMRLCQIVQSHKCRIERMQVQSANKQK